MEALIDAHGLARVDETCQQVLGFPRLMVTQQRELHRLLQMLESTTK